MKKSVFRLQGHRFAGGAIFLSSVCPLMVLAVRDGCLKSLAPAEARVACWLVFVKIEKMAVQSSRQPG